MDADADARVSHHTPIKLKICEFPAGSGRRAARRCVVASTRHASSHLFLHSFPGTFQDGLGGGQGVPRAQSRVRRSSTQLLTRRALRSHTPLCTDTHASTCLVSAVSFLFERDSEGDRSKGEKRLLKKEGLRRGEPEHFLRTRSPGERTGGAWRVTIRRRQC